jgi:murein DD-endopeptidase MepM/ murein hydrolase activator NlpD
LTNYFDHDLPLGTSPGTGYQLTFCDERMTGRIDAHRGYDWMMPTGTPLLALADGEVTFAGVDSAFYCGPLGRIVADQQLVEIRHPAATGEDLSSVFVHFSRIDVRVGQLVRRGQVIGLSGNTGCSTEPHLHLDELRLTGTNTGRPTVVDPYGWEGAAQDPWSLDPSGSASVWMWRPGEAPALRPR